MVFILAKESQRRELKSFQETRELKRRYSMCQSTSEGNVEFLVINFKVMNSPAKVPKKPCPLFFHSQFPITSKNYEKGKC